MSDPGSAADRVTDLCTALEDSLAKAKAARLQRGGHDLGRITWDAVANWQCSLCHRVYEFPMDATEDPCDVRYPDEAGAVGA